MRILVCLLLPICLAAQNAAASPWYIVFAVRDKVNALCLKDDRIVAASPELLAPPVEVRIRREPSLFVSNSESCATSPDGTRVAHTLMDCGGIDLDARKLAVSAADGSNPVLLTTDERIDGLPAWFPDGKRLLYRRERIDGSRTISEAVVHDLETNAVTPFADQGASSWPRPLFLVYGCLLYSRERKDRTGPEGSTKLDIVIANPEKPSVRTLLLEGGSPVREFEATPNGMALWLIGENQIRRVDRRARTVTHRWTLQQLQKPGWEVTVGQVRMRPDGDALAITFWALEQRFGGEKPGQHTIVVIDVNAPENAQVTHHVAAHDVWLRGFCRERDLR